jgi:hypothetical protein
MKSTVRLMVATTLLLLAVDAAAVFTMEGQRKSFEIRRTDSPPIIDGKLDDAVWTDAAWVDDFHQTAPFDGAQPTERTVVRVTYDDDFIYIAANLEDSDPQAIQAMQMIQGKMFYSDDRFWVTLDSFNNKRNDYFFQVNANEVRRDALRENNARFIDEWATIWHAESQVHESGWSTEIAIPFKSISFAPESDTWGINFGRGIVRKQEYNMWSSHERQDWPAYGGEVTGIGEIEQGLGLDVVPSVNMSENRNLVEGDSSSGVDPSLDLRYRFTPSLSATLTVNTDFSTSDVDEQQVALDRFSLFFPEKRDFFLQDAGIFEFGNIDTNGRPFFSRRIGLASDGSEVGLDGGIKLTGRIGDFSVGALAIRQEADGDIAATDLFVARGSYNVLDESSVGFIMTHGDPASNDSNSVVGADFLYRNSDGPFGEILTGNFWAQKSTSPDAGSDDQAYGIHVEIPNDKLEVYGLTRYIGEDFRPALGFVNRAGIKHYATGARYRVRPETGRWRALNFSVDYGLVTDIENETLSEELRFMPLSFYSHRDDYLFAELRRKKEIVREEFGLFAGRLSVPAGEYEFDRYRAELRTGMQRPLRVVLAVEDGGFFGGDRLMKSVEVQWRQSAYLSLGLGFTENIVDLPSGSFTSHLANLRTDVAFNSRWSWSNFLQYDNSAELAGINSRLRYMPEAGQELVFVLNHGVSVDQGNHVSTTHSGVNIKMSYTFRY